MDDLDAAFGLQHPRGPPGESFGAPDQRDADVPRQHGRERREERATDVGRGCAFDPSSAADLREKHGGRAVRIDNVGGDESVDIPLMSASNQINAAYVKGIGGKHLTLRLAVEGDDSADYFLDRSVQDARGANANCPKHRLRHLIASRSQSGSADRRLAWNLDATYASPQRSAGQSSTAR